jgi:Protein of unknown function (DUF1572)
MSIASEYLKDMADRFHQYKTQADQAIAQVSDEDLFRVLDPESNSIAVLMRHLAGNMRSRWVAFLTTDGEKPDRRRDQEFEAPPVRTRAALTADWESGWTRLFDELATFTSADLERTVTARHEPMSVVSAVNRQLGHTALHTGQIILLAKHFAGGAWTAITIPKGRSSAYNEEMRKKFSK